MKQHKLYLILIILFIFNDACSGQQLVKSTKDASKILTNKSQFIDKPLIDFLKEIKPKIQSVSASTSAYPNHPNIGYFNFKFVSAKQNDSLKLKGKIPVTITVYVEGPFVWDADKKRSNNFIWTKEDENKYGNLIVKAFRVYGED